MTTKPTRDLDGTNAADGSGRSAAFRHATYQRLLELLPAASYAQTEQFVANLGLARTAFAQPTARSRESELFRTMQRFLFLRVSPNIATVGNAVARSRTEIEQHLEQSFGDTLRSIAGFYRSDDGERWRLNLPDNCAFYGYRSRHGFLNGVLCQPIDTINSYFLLSAAKFGGPKAIRLEPRDQSYFEQGKEPAQLRHNTAAPFPQANLAGLKWNGRRFIERN